MTTAVSTELEPRQRLVGEKDTLAEMMDGMTVRVADGLHSLVMLLASIVRARYSTVEPHTLVIAAPLSATLVQEPPAFFCHW